MPLDNLGTNRDEIGSVSTPSRRRLLQTLTAGLAGRSLVQGAGLPPVRAITKGPKHHWFGYYDKLQFDPSSRYALGMEVDFEHRSPRPDDAIRIGLIDTSDSDRWQELGVSRAWGWQQGCMLQWIPGSDTDVIWNDRQDDLFVSHVLNVKTGQKRTIPAPVYALAPDGKWAVRPNFARLNDTRPGYGYVGLPDRSKDEGAPADDGLWKIDLTSGNEQLIFSFADASRIPFEPPSGMDLDGAEKSVDLEIAKHWFNHLLVSPDGSRFVFLHRWQAPGDKRYLTRMFTIANDGSDPYVIDPYGKTSHFIWRDPKSVLAWAWHPSNKWGFYLYTDKTGRVEDTGRGVMTENGHCTYLPGGKWILNDTYPDQETREQHVYLYEIASGRRVPVGNFHSPPAYTGEWRCDTHPRSSPDGRKVSVDSPHGGNGRQLYLIDISGIVA
jgi:hypothetical protein